MLVLGLIFVSPMLYAQSAAPTNKMKLLIHITVGPENPTRAALGFLTARTAIDAGHSVTLFLAGAAVQLLRNNVLDNLAGLVPENFGNTTTRLSAKVVSFICQVCPAKPAV